MGLITLVGNGLMVVGLGTTLGVAYYSWQNKHRPTARSLTVIMLLAAMWIGAEFGKQLMNTPLSKEILRRVAFALLLFTVFAYVVFALRYAGYEEYLTPRNLGILAIHPVLVTLLVFTNDYAFASNAADIDVIHRLMWVQVAPMGEGDFVRGLMFYVHTTYTYLAMIATTLLLIYRTQTRDDVYQAQGIAISAAVLVPLAANALTLAPIFEIPDLTPAGLGVTGAALFWGMKSYGIGEVAPVARENVVQSLSAGILVVDAEGAVSEINERTTELFDIEDEEVIGTEFEELFSHLPAFVERYADVEETTDEIQVEIDDPRTFDVQVSPVVDQGDTRVGRLFMFHDVTERKRRERELKLQNKQLDQFASLVSHEIQSPLGDVRSRIDDSLDHVSTENRGDLLKARKSLEEVDELVDDILSMTSQGGAVGPEDADRVNVATVVDGAWYEVTKRKLPATLNVADFDLLADPDRLERIFVNLFENAVKYGGRDVTVEVGMIDDEVTGERGFYVEDDGPGIPEDARQAVLDAGVTGADDSPGLGLAIVETMAEAHDWEVRVADSTMGGARFEFVGVTIPERRTSAGGPVVGRASDD